MMRSHGFEKLIPIVTLVVCVAVMSIPAWAESARDQRAAIIARTLRSRGEWQNAAPARHAQRPWDLDVTRADDGSLTGRVALVGSPLMQVGRLSGTIEGRRVTGSVTDEAGNHVATFVGRVRADGGLQGTYQDRTGEVGRWTWNGQLPR